MDPIADMLTQIRNAQAVGKERIELSHSKVRSALAKLFFSGRPFISHIRRISKPGQRIYAGKDNLPRVLGGNGLVVVSTSRGLMSGKEAKKKGLGGELVCELW